MLDFLDQKRQYYIEQKASAEVILMIDMAIARRNFLEEEGFYSETNIGDLTFEFENNESNEEVLDTMILHSGEIWYYLFMADFHFNNKKISARTLEREFSKLNTFINATGKLDEYQLLFVDGGKNDGSNLWEIEYLRLKSEYYFNHRLQKVGFFTSIAYVYGRYFRFYDYLNSLLNGINNKLTNRQQALYYLYLSKAEYETRSMKEYAETLGLETIKSFTNQYKEIQAGADRRISTSFNVRDLEKVRERLKGKPRAIQYLNEDLEHAHGYYKEEME